MSRVNRPPQDSKDVKVLDWRPVDSGDLPYSAKSELKGVPFAAPPGRRNITFHSTNDLFSEKQGLIFGAQMYSCAQAY